MTDRSTQPRIATPRIRIEAPALRESAPLFSTAVQAYLVEGLGRSATDPETVHVRLAITEAITNVIRHGFADGAPGWIEVEMHCHESELVTVISDDGKRFNPRDSQHVKLPSPEELREGGYGLGILFRVMDDVEHSWSGGNRLTLRKRLNCGGEESEHRA